MSPSPVAAPAAAASAPSTDHARHHATGHPPPLHRCPSVCPIYHGQPPLPMPPSPLRSPAAHRLRSAARAAGIAPHGRSPRPPPSSLRSPVAQAMQVFPAVRPLHLHRRISTATDRSLVGHPSRRPSPPPHRSSPVYAVGRPKRHDAIKNLCRPARVFSDLPPPSTSPLPTFGHDPLPATSSPPISGHPNRQAPPHGHSLSPFSSLPMATSVAPASHHHTGGREPPITMQATDRSGPSIKLRADPAV